MDTATAKVRLQAMTAWDQEPALLDAEVDALVDIAARIDATWLAPSDAAWTGNYDLNAGAAEGWRWKAGRVSGQFDFATDQQRFDRSNKHDMCMAMAEHYQKRVSGSIRVKGSLPIITPAVVLIPADDLTP